MEDKGRDVVWDEACDLSESSTFGINLPCNSIYTYIYRSNLCRSVWENYKTYRDDQQLIQKEIKWSIE